MEAQNQILLDDKVGGKGRFFRTRFLQPGLVKYSFGVCLLEKETIDKFVYHFTGCPVIINHKDVTSESAKDDRVGVISRVEYNQGDGWYWGEGVIFEQEALDLIDKGYNVSCQYEITEYSSTGGIHNGNEYDKTILNGKPEHLAIVQNPRYENALISVNSIDIEEIEAINEEKKEEKPLTYIKKDDKTIPIFNNHFSKKTGLYKYDKVIDDEKSAERNKMFPKLVFMTPDKYIEKCVQGFNEEFIRNNQKTITKKELEDDRYSDKSSMEYLNNNFNNDKFDLPFIEYYTRETGEIQFANQEGLHRAIVARDNNISKIPVMIFSSNYYGENVNNDLLKENLEYICSEFKDKAKNDIIQAINDIKGLDMFKNLFRKKEKNMDREEIKSIMMECLTELTASNEIKEEKEAENKCKNEEPDYKKLYEDLKAKCEKQAKNEDEVDVEEKEDKKDVEAENKKAKNEIESQKEAMMSSKVESKPIYITQSRARELGKELF